MEETASGNRTHDDAHNRLKRPKKFVTFIFALLCPGLGHIYCGHHGVGLAIFVFCHVLWAGMVSLLAWMDTSLVTIFYVVAIWLTIMHIAQIIWAVILCGNNPRVTKPKVLCHPVFYVLMVVLGFFSPERLVLREFVIESYKISSVSMVPSLMVGDIVIVNKLKRAQPGDIIVYKRADHFGADTRLPHLEQDYMDYMARLVALEGQTVEFKDGRLIQDGKQLSAGRAGEFTFISRDSLGGAIPVTLPLYVEQTSSKKYEIVMEDEEYDFGPVTVPNGEFFVVGDNRDNSLDSRYLSTFPVSRISGVAASILFSADHRIRWDRIGIAL